MEENRMKKNVQKTVKENIAISNWKEEAYMEKRKNRKIWYGVLSSCALFALCAGIVITNVPLGKNDNSILQGKLEDLRGEKEVLKTEININQMDEKMLKDFAIDAETRKMDALESQAGDLRFAIEATVPKDFEANYSVVGIYIKGKDSKKYDELLNYEFYYSNKDKTRSITLGLGFKDKHPMRDYYFMDVERMSKIGDVELKITQYEDSYLVIFSHKDVNYDIETNGITKEELVEFLTSLISNSKSYEQIVAKDEEAKVKEPVKNSDGVYPNYYAGKYIDNQGNNVILLKVDTKENRKAICNLLEITESKTRFEKAKYSYQYLTELQSKISQKMINKELPFAISSSIMEDKNWIEVQVTTNKESELKKIKELDTIGGAISVRYCKESEAKTDMLIEKE